MSSTDGESDGGPETAKHDLAGLGHDPVDDGEVTQSELNHRESSNFRDLARETREDLDVDADLRHTLSRGYGQVQRAKEGREEESSNDAVHQNLKGATSPGSSISAPDDTPSIQGSVLSSPGSNVPVSRAVSSLTGTSQRLGSFDRRFHSRLSPSPFQSPRAASPAFLSANSRTSSVGSQILRELHDEAETPQAPWEVIRWTKLKRITGQAFSEQGKRNFGRPNCLAVSAQIVVGTSKGIILVFDYQQSLKAIIGQGTKAVECGGVTSLAISADHSTIAGGHANGSIFTWDLARPAKPFLQLPPMAKSSLENRKVDGHLLDSAVLHIGFLGTRHTALVSADDAGMAFSHLATRGLGVVGRSVKTTRLLGRYPEPSQLENRTRKPSSVLAFSPLPLGNVEQSTDTVGLTALLTPYLLVIVSTTPIAQTQHKASRPKEIAAHSTLSGCLAWFPAVRLRKDTNESEVEPTSRTKLVYSWSNILTILDIQEVQPAQPDGKNETTNFQFRARSRWRSEEAIVALQWLSRSVLGVLTITQRLIILEDYSLRVTDSSDLIQKHVYHQDLFSRQLHPVVEQLDEEDESMHGVIADAFYMSFRAYKGRLFVLGFNDISIGTLSNWADRLLALMGDGDYLGAIRLATSFYKGDAEKLTVGLPDDDLARHNIVRDKLLEMISASVRYTFGDDLQRAPERPSSKALEDLLNAAFEACLNMDVVDFLFEDVYEWYQRGSAEPIFFEILEPYVIEGKITTIPPDVLKNFIAYYTSKGRQQRIEDVLCRLSTQSFDIDQITTLCKKHLLYDALIYVWNNALLDYVTPLVELLFLIKVSGGDQRASDDQESRYLSSAMKVFPYLAFVLTSREYPSGGPLDAEVALMAKSDLYGFLFSGVNIAWPRSGGQVIYTTPNVEKEPAYPYLHLLLKFDAESTLSMLNEAFEDSYLNESEPLMTNGQLGRQEDHLEARVNRRKIVNILLSIMRPPAFGPEDTIFLNMFIARNLAKFAQFLELPGSIVHQVIIGLCRYPFPAVAEDSQISVEYLLSVYHPPDLQSLIPFLAEARFYRVLKQVYRAERQYANLLETFFDDPEGKDGVFDCIRDCLRPSAGLSKKQLDAVKLVIINHAKELTRIDTIRFAECLKSYSPDLLDPTFSALNHDSHTQFVLLRAVLEPNVGEVQSTQNPPEADFKRFIEPYVRLMCQYDPMHVADYVGLLSSGNLRLHEVLPAMESSGVIDAAVILLARDGLVKDAMSRLTSHLSTLESAITGIISAAAQSPDPANTQEATTDLLNGVHKHAKVGIWLCQGQSKIAARSNRGAKRNASLAELSESNLAEDELLWLELLDALVITSQRVTKAVQASFVTGKGINAADIIDSLRSAVQQAFTALLTSTATDTKDQQPSAPTLRHDVSFLRILRAFLSRASRFSPSFSDLRAALADIFAAYAYEENILSLANRFLDKDLFVHVAEANALRRRGWRPKGQLCDGCKRRVWGPGAGGHIWDTWEKKQHEEKLRRERKRIERGANDAVEQLQRDKGKATATGSGLDGMAGLPTEDEHNNKSPGGRAEQDLGALVIFSCRHLYHQKCLEQVQAEKGMEFGCLLCQTEGSGL